MATSVAELAINIVTSIAGLQVGLRQATSEVAGFASTVGRQIATASDRVNALGAAFGKLAGLTIAGFGVNAFESMVSGAIDAQAKLHDLAQSAGTTASELSSLIPASRLSGVSIESVATAAGKFSKNLIDVQSGTGKAAEAFKALGFSARDADEFLKRPTDGLFQLAKRMNEFRDDGYKTAAGMELLGKNFAQLAPFMKELGEQSQLTARLTDEQAAAADRLQDQLALLKLASDEAKQSFVQSLIPALTDMATNFNIARQNGQGFFASLLQGMRDNDTNVERITNLSKQIRDTQDAMALASQQTNPLFNSRFQAEEIEKLTQKLKDLGVELRVITQIRDANIFRNLEGQFTGDVRDRLADNSAFKLTAKVSVDFAPVADNAKVAIDRIARELDKLEEKWRGIFTSNEVAIDPATATSLTELDRLLDAGRISWDEYVRGLESALDADKRLAEEQKALTEAISQTYKILDDLEAQAEPTSDAFVKLAESFKSGTNAIQQQNEQLRIQVDTFGMSEQAAIQHIAAQQRIAVAALDVADGLKKDRLAAIDYNEALQLTALGQKNATESLHSVFETLDSVARGAFDAIADKGANMWERIKDSGKRILLDFLYSLTLRPFLITIAASLTGVSGQAAANTLGTGGNSANPLSFLTGGGGGSLTAAAGNLFFGAGSTGAAAMGAGFSAGIETLSIAASAGVEAIGGVSAAIGAAASVASAAIPVIGTVLAIALASGVFDKKPSEVRGRFLVSPGTNGFEDNAFTASTFGNLGFSDADTAQFSGKAAQVFNKIVGGALDAFEARYTAEQSDRLASILQSTDFGSFEGTFTTQDFIEKYGGQVLQQVVVAAFDVLDPALAKVASGFTGTADEIAAFGNTLLGVYDASKGLSETVRANVIGALDSTTETATKVLSFVHVLQTFGDALTGLRPALEGLDPSKIGEFVDALGGAQAFFDSFGYLSQNFLTTAERTAQATAQLTAAFDALGEAVPETHRAFLDMINAAIAAGNVDLAASLQKLAPLFVAVKGTADQAAGALDNLGNAAGDAADAIKQAAAEITVSTGQLVEAGKSAAAKLLDSISELAGASTGDFGDKLGIQIDLIRDALDKAGAIQGPTGDFRLLGGSQADKIYVSELSKSYIQFAGELARFTILSAQYDAARAEQLVSLEEWYAAQQKIFTGNDAALTALGTIFQQKWDAIVNGTAEAAQALDDFIAKIQGIANATGGNAGQQAGIELALSSARLGDLQAQYAAALPGSAIAKALQADITKLQAYNVGLATQIAHFATYSQQYGKDVANQLVELEQQFETWKASVGGNADALAIVTDIFNERFADIVNGIKDGVDELSRLKVDIADYLKSLVISDVSPLSPTQRLAEAQNAYVDTLMKAQAGDLTALGDITRFADAYIQQASDFYSSSQAFVNIFDAVREQLAELAGSQPNGLPLPGAETSGANALNAVLPSGGKMASNSDVEAQTKALADNQADMTTATIDTIENQTVVMSDLMRRLLNAIERQQTPSR